VKFTTDDLYEQAKAVLRQALPQLGIKDEQDRPFILACHECGLPFRLELEVGMLAEHARVEHDVNVEEAQLKLDLIYIGHGPPPEGTPPL
jgi:hypothetical protein